ncbi:MAG: hypothetical protein OXU63_13300, partial [Acidobacteriota bacterium]|nr:hypothetical protein [Acidobacteriota bacterium]
MTGFFQAGFGRPRRPPAGERRFGWPPAPAPGSGGRTARPLLFLVLAAAAAGAQTPVDVPVTAVPITVTSTEADYFVLYVKHELSENDVRHVAVSLTRGAAGTTDLNMTVPGLPAARYKVEKYAIANPADVDGDGTDDLTDPNPLNPARDIALTDGRNLLSTTAEWNAIEFKRAGSGFFAPGANYVKMIAYPGDVRPSAYFLNAATHGGHFFFVRDLTLPGQGFMNLEIDRETGMAGTEADAATYYFWFSSAAEAIRGAASVPVLHSTLSANLPIMAAEAAKWRLAYYIPERAWSAVDVAKIEESVPTYEQAGITVLTDRSFASDFPDISVSGGQSVTEGQNATFTFTASKAPKKDVTVWFDVGDSGGGGFLAPDDRGRRSVTMPKDDTSVDWTVPTVNDEQSEPHGNVHVALVNPVRGNWPRSLGYFRGRPELAEVAVRDDDPAVSLSVSANPVQEGAATGIEAKLTNPWTADLTVPLVVTAGSAEAGDYAAPASIAITKGRTSGKAALSTVADLDTDDETLTVALDEANLPAGVLVGSPKSVTISIADLTPAVSLSVSENPVEEGDSTDVEATLTKSWPSDLTIPLVVTAGSAEADDYAAPASVTVAKGGTSGKAALSTVADLRADDETLTIAIDKANLPAGVAAGSPDSVDLVIRDTTPTTAPEVTLEADPAALDEGE